MHKKHVIELLLHISDNECVMISVETLRWQMIHLSSLTSSCQAEETKQGCPRTHFATCGYTFILAYYEISRLD